VTDHGPLGYARYTIHQDGVASLDEVGGIDAGNVRGGCVPGLPARAAQDAARVVILNGFDPYLPSYMRMDNGMRAILAKESSKRIEFYYEQLDANRFAVGPRDPELSAALAKKYARSGFEALLSRHQLTFADHGAKFYAGSGHDAHKALVLARVNVENRPTRRAAERMDAIASPVPSSFASSENGVPG